MWLFKRRKLTEYEQWVKEVDWFSKASWFNAYFWDKLKDMLLNIIYTLYTSIEDKLLRKYFLEITFYSPKSQHLDAFNKKNKTNHKGDFKCYLPLILKVKNIEEGRIIHNAILAQIMKSGATIIDGGKLKECDVPAVMDTNILMVQNKFKNAKVARLNIETLLTIPIPPNENEGEIVSGIDTKYNRRIDKFQFTIMKVRPDAKYHLEDYHVVLYKNEGDDE